VEIDAVEDTLKVALGFLKVSSEGIANPEQVAQDPSIRLCPCIQHSVSALYSRKLIFQMLRSRRKIASIPGCNYLLTGPCQISCNRAIFIVVRRWCLEQCWRRVRWN
jgi:hypothetical protein